jgi:hypothetical protein
LSAPHEFIPTPSKQFLVKLGEGGRHESIEGNLESSVHVTPVGASEHKTSRNETLKKIKRPIEDALPGIFRPNDIAELENVLDTIESIIKIDGTDILAFKPICPARFSEWTL